MAQISLSPLVVDIRNKVADMVFSKWKGVNYVRSRVVPSNPQTAAQTAIRDALAQLVALWGLLGTAAQLNNNFWATGKNLSGFNRWVGRNTVAQKDGDPLNITNDFGYQPITGWNASAGAGSGQVDVAWTSGAVPAAHSLQYYVYDEPAKLFMRIASWPAATASPQTISGLTPSASVRVYGFLTLAATPNGDEVGKDQTSAAVVTP